jgi:hypothetical protein
MNTSWTSCSNSLSYDILYTCHVQICPFVFLFLASTYPIDESGATSIIVSRKIGVTCFGAALLADFDPMLDFSEFELKEGVLQSVSLLQLI